MDPQLPSFETGPPIGEGAIGRVLSATLTDAWGELPAGTPLAVKRLRPELRGDPAARAGLRRESELATRLRHPGLVRGIARGSDADGPWLAMVRVPGPTLRKLLARDGPLPEPEWRAVAARLAGALAELHAAGHLHGDIKPENVRLDAHGEPVLIDLGFARPTTGAREGPDQARAGSLLYLSPEQARGGRGDERSELFTLGLVLHELAAGTHPFVHEETRDAADALRALAEARLEPPSRLVPALSPFADALLEELLERDPSRRPSASELHARLAGGEAGPWWSARLRAEPTPPWRPTSSDPRLPFVGRARELEQLEALWDERSARRGALVWMWGEVGTGKSRLVEEFVRGLRRSSEPPQLLTSRCLADEEERPAEPMLQLLQGWLGLARGAAPRARDRRALESVVPPAEAAVLFEALDPVTDAAAGAAVPAALARWLSSIGRTRPTVVFLDDLDRAGGGTLQALERLLEAGLVGARLLLLFGLREPTSHRRPRALERLRRLVAPGTRELELELGPIDRGAVRELVERCFHPEVPRLGLAGALWERSHGNPGFLVELLRGMLARGDVSLREDRAGEPRLTLRIPVERIPWPRSLREAISVSFRRLPAGDRRWLARLAVAGGRIRADLLRATWPDTGPVELDETLVRLATAGWLVRVGDRYRFAWPALRETVYRTLGPERRGAMHADVARALEPPAGGRLSLSDAFQLAYHLRAADRPVELLAAIERLLPRLVERGRPRRLHSLCRWGLEALETLPPSPERERLALDFLEAAADAADRLGHRADQRRFLDELAELELDPERDPELAGRVYLLHARYAIGVGQYGVARGMLRNAVEWLERAGHDELLGDAVRRLAAVQAHVGELEQAGELARRARELATSELLRARAEITLGVVAVLSDEIEEALRKADHALRLLRGSRSPLADGTRAVAHQVRARAYRSGGRPRRALASAQRALRLARQAGEGRLVAEMTARLGGHLLDVDRPREAEERLREALRVAGEIEDRRSEAIASAFLGILLAEAERDEAPRWLKRSMRVSHDSGLHRIEAVARAILARRLRATGRTQAALEQTLQAMSLLERYGAELLDRTVIVGSHAVVLHELGRSAEAERLVGELRRVLRRENRRLTSPLLRRRQRVALLRLLRAVLSSDGPIYPRLRGVDARAAGQGGPPRQSGR